MILKLTGNVHIGYINPQTGEVESLEPLGSVVLEQLLPSPAENKSYVFHLSDFQFIIRIGLDMSRRAALGWPTTYIRPGGGQFRKPLYWAGKDQ